MAPGTARNGNLATAADFVPRSIVTSPERLTSTRYGCFNTVGVAVSPGANGAQLYGATGARVYGAKLGYGDGSWMTSEGAKVSSTVGDAIGCTVGTSLGSVVGNTDGSDVGTGVGGLGAEVVGKTEG